MKRGVLFGLSAALALSACTTLPFDWFQPALSRPVADTFVLNARVAISNNDVHQSADLRWVHTQQRDELLFLAPLGKVVARIFQDQGSAQFEDGEQVYQAATIEDLMNERLGWYLPVEYLHRWILGDVDAQLIRGLQRNEFGQVSQFEYENWQVSYLAYVDEQANSLPKRIVIQQGGLRIKLVVDKWE